MLEIFVMVVLIGYALLVLVFWLGWEKAQPCGLTDKVLLPVSIIIAVRNEEKNIDNLLKDIARQNYPKNLFEVIVIDDHSTDKTLAIINERAKSSSINIICEKLGLVTGKKEAIAKAIEIAKHEIILTTDGDCRLKPGWLQGMARCFINPTLQFISGPVRLFPQKTFFQRLQAIEFTSLIASGAATLMLGWPTMANAANMAFRKSAFKKVRGNNKKVQSGDDVFLLHGISKIYKSGYTFCRDANTIVDAESSSGISSFYQQRMRWSGKWQHYNDVPTKLLAVFIFLVNLILLSLPLLVFYKILSWELAANLFAIKLLFEFWFLRESQKFFNSKFLLHEFIILAIIYPFYVIFMALAGLIGNYNWKGRSVK